MNKLPAEDLKYTYLLETDGLTGKLLKDHSIEFYEKNSKEPVFILPAPYMLDSNEKDPQKSDEVDVSLREVKAGAYELSYTPSGEWLKDKKRVYPVAIDPTIKIPGYESRYSQNSYFVMTNGSELLLQYPNLPYNLGNYAITKATFNLTGRLVTPYVNDFTDVELYELTSPWDSVSVDNKTYKYNPDMVACSKGPDYEFDITALVHKWYTGNNYGMMLRYTGSLMGVMMPDIGAPEEELYYLTIDYTPIMGISDDYSMRSLDNGTAGIAYLNDFTGQLCVKATDYIPEGSVLAMPITRFFDKHNLSWQFGFNQTIDTKYDGSGYSYYDENGVEIIFDKKNSEGVWVDSKGKGYELTNASGMQIKTPNNLVYTFQSIYYNWTSYILSSIQDLSQPAKPKVTINRAGWPGSPVEKIVDGSGNEYIFSYESNYSKLKQITITGVGTLKYEKSKVGVNDCLSSVTYNDTLMAGYEYSVGENDYQVNLASMTNMEKNKLSFSYDPVNRTTKIQAYTNNTLQSTMDVSYDVLQTTISHPASGNKLIEQFNYLGELTSSRDGLGNMMHLSNINTENGKLSFMSDVQPPVNNLLQNSGFETGGKSPYEENYIAGSSSDVSVNYNNTNSTYVHTGNRALSVFRKGDGAYRIYQPVNAPISMKGCTLSAWIKTDHSAQVRLYVSAGSKSEYSTLESSNEWKKISVYFTEPIAAGTVTYANIVIQGAGNAYIDDIQLTPGVFDFDTNLIENGDFSSGIYNWSVTGNYQAVTYQPESKLDSKAIKASGQKSDTVISQIVYLNAKKGESFIYGGWTIGDTLPIDTSEGSNQAFGMRVTDPNGKVLSYFNFNPYISGKTQYMRNSLTLEQDTSYVTVSFVKQNVYGTAIFDGAEFLKKGAYISSGGDSGSGESGNSGQQNPEDVSDEYGRVIKRVKDGLTTTYQYDDYGNRTKETASDGNTSMETTKNYKEGTTLVTDESDGVLINSKYGYNGAGLNTSTQQGNQKTTYGYDNLYRLATVSNTIGTASYSYNNNGLLNQIKNGNTSFDFSYNTANQLSSVSVGGNNLISYLYNSFGITNENYANGQSVNYTYDDKWNLSRIKFGSEVRATFVYDDFGTMIAAKDQLNDNYYKYVQDGIEVWDLNQTQLKEQHLTKNDEQVSSKFIAHYNQIYDGSVYRIKNHATGKYLDIDENNVVQKDLDKNSKTQQFKFDYISGSYGNPSGYKLVPVSDSSKAVTSSSDQLVNNSSGSLFNFGERSLGRFNMLVEAGIGRMNYYFGVKPGGSIYFVQSNGSNYNLLGEDNFQWGLEEVFALDSTDMHSYSGESVSYDMINNGNGQDISYWYPGRSSSSAARTRTSYDSFGRVNNQKVMREIYGSTFADYTLINHDVGYFGGSKTTNLLSRENFDFGNGSSRYQYYSYDASGNIIHTLKNSKGIEYQYDAAGQLARENNEEQYRTFTYEYDKSGNILSKKEYRYNDGSSPLVWVDQIRDNTYEYKNSKWADQLTSYNGSPITYDQVGNPLSYRSWTFSWEGGRQLKQAKRSGSQIDYAYDYTGLRTAKTVNSVTTKYSLCDDQILAQITNGKTTQFRYDADGKLMSINYDDDEYFYVLNMLGDVLGLVDESGTLVVEYTYDTWGKIVSTTGSKASTLGQANPFRYRSYYYDTETSLYYLQSRYYDPETGRFINADDPVMLGFAYGDLRGVNLFAYCDNNPVMRVDYYGTTSIEVSKSVNTNTIAFKFGMSIKLDYKNRFGEDFLEYQIKSFFTRFSKGIVSIRKIVMELSYDGKNTSLYKQDKSYSLKESWNTSSKINSYSRKIDSRWINPSYSTKLYVYIYLTYSSIPQIYWFTFKI